MFAVISSTNIKCIITQSRIAVEAVIPKRKTPKKRRKEYQLYNEDVNNLNTNLNRLKKQYRKTRDPEDLIGMLI